ncbi:hypothetical protein JRQ81_006655, partial [Phrynocephalus forsythii]
VEMVLKRRESTRMPDKVLGDDDKNSCGIGLNLGSSRGAQSDEEKESGWDAWGAWSDCSRTCGGGASYSLRRCLNGRNCEGRNIRYKTCSNNDCPAEAGDFRAQQCSAYNDVKYQGRFYEWVPVYGDSSSPCALQCQALGQPLVVELAPKVLDGTRCNAKSLDMCISGICQAVGCDRQLGSHAKEDNCGVCGGEGSTCRLVRGQTKTLLSAEKSKFFGQPKYLFYLRLSPSLLAVIESKTLQGESREQSFGASGTFVLENTTVDFQKSSERETLKIPGPLGADFIIKVRYTAPKDSTVQFFFYQPISHQWRQTDFFPCSVTCGGGYQLNSAECMDIRSKRVVPDQYCHYYPENKKPKPKLKECNMDPCPSSDGFKEIMPYDHFQPLPRWEHNPWTACSVSCGGGIQRRSFVCVEETMHGEILQVEEWKCMYAPKPKIIQACNLFDCPKWVALEWSQHTGGCNPQLKLHIKEECILPVPCYKPKEKNPVEAKLPWSKQAHEMEEIRTTSEEPTFIPEPWSPCSASCGRGIQAREVKCRIYLAFTQTEVELPAEECEGPQPATERPCHLQPCDSDPDPPFLDYSHPGETEVPAYDWEYIGFTPCSATCVGGTQEAIAVCLHEETKQTVNDSLCDSSRRPPAMSRVCSTRLCPPRWQVGPWTQCSATCGVGIQTRKVHCQHPEGSVVGPENCKLKKPHALQACNQIDCPPVWHVEEWQQCSQTCGGGTQNRQVTCQQLLMDGSFRKLAEDKCHEPRLSTHKPCAKTDCPPQLVVGECCGIGTQTRKLICQKVTAKGHRVTLNASMCSSLPAPPLVRPCHMHPCNKMKQATKPKFFGKYASHRPQILSIRRVYIQTRQEKRINFTIGSRAYLLPKTSVIIKCPVRRYQKSLIHWEKDGQRLQISKRLGITKSGSLKINSLEATDIGVYKCVAGTAQETFVLKLIGADNRLIERPPSFRKPPGGSSAARLEHNEANRFGAKWHKMSQMWHLWSQKEEQYAAGGQANDQPFLRHLETHARNLPEEDGSREFGDKRLEAVVLPGAYSMDTAHFEELIKNLSHLVEAGEVNDDLASHLVYQLISELSKPSTTDKLKESREEKFVSRKPGKSSGLPDNHSTKAQGKAGRVNPKGPLGTKRRGAPKVYTNRTVTVRVGSPVFVTKDVHVVNLICGTAGTSNPKYTWMKDGTELMASEKVILETSGRVQILNLTREEMGVYQCGLEHDFGSTMETSAVFYAEAPTIPSSETNTTALQLQSLPVPVGGTILAKTGANIALECPAKGVPLPEVAWFKDNRSSRSRVIPSVSGSLLLRNVSEKDAGTYTCTATNVLGQARVATLVQLMEETLQGPNNGSSAIHGRKKRVLMASGIGTNVTVEPGDLLRIGCPVHPSAKNTIRWSFRNQPVQEIGGLSPRSLVRGRILEVKVASDRFAGQYRCWSSSSTKPLSVWVNVKKEEYRWERGEWDPCSATCGNAGTQFQRLECVNAKEEKSDRALCKESPKPAAIYQPCNIQDCPPRWSTSAWSECSALCGNGFRQRQRFCKQLKANGTVIRLSPDACTQKGRPLERKPCVGYSCTEWIVHPWGQCTGQCVGRGVGVQHRRAQCQYQNGTAVLTSLCNDKERPTTRRNCSSEKCDVYWRTGPWRPCTADCGSGFQSRQVGCIHWKNKRPVVDQSCAWRKRPATWRHCNVTPCGSM